MVFANRDSPFGAGEGLLHCAHGHDEGKADQCSVGEQNGKDWLSKDNQYLPHLSSVGLGQCADDYFIGHLVEEGRLSLLSPQSAI